MNSVVVKNKFASPVISHEEYKLKSSLFNHNKENIVNQVHSSLILDKNYRNKPPKKINSLRRKSKNVQRYYKD
jgi:hypothetical protein